MSKNISGIKSAISSPQLIREYSHTPDAVFSLEKDGSPALFFLEIDRGGEIVSDPDKGFLKCIVFYLHYWKEKKWIRYNEDFKREFRNFRLTYRDNLPQRFLICVRQ